MYRQYEPRGGEVGLVVRWFLVIVTIVVVLGAISWALGWISLPGKVLNPQETLDRWREYYDTYQSLVGQGATIQQWETRIEDFKTIYGDASKWDWQAKEQYGRITTERDGFVANYNRVAQGYNAKMRDITRSYIRPGDLPKCVPNWDTEACEYEVRR